MDGQFLGFALFSRYQKPPCNGHFLEHILLSVISLASFFVFPRCFPGDMRAKPRGGYGQAADHQARCRRPEAAGEGIAVWDSKLPGFGVRVRPTGAMSYVVVYRAGSGRGAPVRRYTIARRRKITPEAARGRAKAILGAVAHGHDPAGEKNHRTRHADNLGTG